MKCGKVKGDVAEVKLTSPEVHIIAGLLSGKTLKDMNVSLRQVEELNSSFEQLESLM